jgi:hypothetical protein
MLGLGDGRNQGLSEGTFQMTHDRIAQLAQSVSIFSLFPGGNCIFRAHAGWLVLKAAGIKSSIVGGGMLYRAGPDEILDTVGYAGRRLLGEVLPNGTFMGHFFLITDKHEVVDFSCPEWVENVTDGSFVDVGFPLLSERPIQWDTPPPKYIWGPLSDYSRGPTSHGQAPEQGKAWYTGWDPNCPVTPQSLLRDAYTEFEDTGAVTLLKNVYRMALEEFTKNPLP